jgi:brefeldin A-inhibited guanine nucleotide-exchange protein
VVAEHNGNSLGAGWQDVLRCVSRFELLQQLSTGQPTDALLFAMPPGPAAAAGAKGRGAGARGRADPVRDSFSSIADMGLQAPAGRPAPAGKDPALPPPEVLRSVDAQELNRLFVHSERLDGDAVVEFVTTLCTVAREELRPGGTPRVFSLTKIVEIAHFNMGRIRLVWARVWAVLADFFVAVGCHDNLQVAMYAVDSLRQLAMKFLERDELANYTFQNDFLRPFVVLMRRSRAAEIRELVVRCVSQMVLARVANVRSGWKSVFMVFTAAASDDSPHIVRLAFDTVERIVREHFHYITETENTTFTDCVNCLVAFTNNPHSLDVSLNAIAFLRFCAIQLAEGDVGVELGPDGLPEGATAAMDPNAHRIRPHGQDGRPAAAAAVAGSGGGGGASPEATNGGANGAAHGGRIRFTDQDEHMYFWFPLLAGLGELTFDPRPEIRCAAAGACACSASAPGCRPADARTPVLTPPPTTPTPTHPHHPPSPGRRRHGALGVLFDILKFHGASFTPQFWARVYDSVLLPMFDHVRAEVTDTTTFTDEARRAEADAWLYEACTATLQHLVDVVVRYHAAVPSLLDRTLALLAGFVRRPHQALAAVGVAALARLAVAAGPGMDEATWAQVMAALTAAAADTLPQVGDLMQHRMERRTDPPASPGRAAAAARPEIEPAEGAAAPAAAAAAAPPAWSLAKGAGARRLAEVRCRAGVQLLLVQACSEVYAAHQRGMPPAAAVAVLDVMRAVAAHATAVDGDVGLRHSLQMAQAADSVPPARALPDPPLLRLEVDAAQAYLAALLQITATGSAALREASGVQGRLVSLCRRNLERFEQQSMAAGAAAVAAGGAAGAPAAAAGLAAENEALAPLAAATLKALLSFSTDVFRAHLRELFPLLTNLISCELAPPEVQKALSELFATRIGDLVA